MVAKDLSQPDLNGFIDEMKMRKLSGRWAFGMRRGGFDLRCYKEVDR